MAFFFPCEFKVCIPIDRAKNGKLHELSHKTRCTKICPIIEYFFFLFTFDM